MVSHQLVAQWRARLAVWQQRLDEGRPRPWVARAYVRVLSYLLAQYGTAVDAEGPLDRIDRTSHATADPKSTRSAMKLNVATEELSGKPPRTPTEIQSVLSAVQASVPHAEKGPLIDGLRPDDPIVMTAFYSLVEVERLVRMLDAQGIRSQTQRFGRKVQILVHMADLERAKAIVAGHAVDTHDSAHWRHNRVEQYRAWGAVIGLFLAVIVPVPLASLLAPIGHSLAVCLALCTGMLLGPCGLLLGHLWGIVATHKLWRGSKV